MPANGAHGGMPRRQPSCGHGPVRRLRGSGCSGDQSTEQRGSSAGAARASAVAPRARSRRRDRAAPPGSRAACALVSLRPIARPAGGARRARAAAGGGGAVGVGAPGPAAPVAAAGDASSAAHERAAATTGAASGSDRRDLLFVGDAERGAAAAGGDDVRVVTWNPAPWRRVDVVDRASRRRTGGSGCRRGSAGRGPRRRVAVALLVEGELVLEARAAAAAHADAQAGEGRVGVLRSPGTRGPSRRPCR